MQLSSLLTLRDNVAAGHVLLSNRKLSKRTKFAGMDVSIETAKGETRSGTGKDGRPWSVVMPYDYGYIRGTMGVDGDHVDCFIGPKEDAAEVYIIHQHVEGKPDQWDEDKCMLGFPSAPAAKRAYKSAFADGIDFYSSMTAMPLEEFKKKVYATKDKPAKIHAEFSEEDHPRDEHGKFVDNGAPQLTPSGKHAALKDMGMYLKQGGAQKDVYVHPKSGFEVHVTKYNTTHPGNEKLRKYALVNPSSGKTIVQGHQISKISQAMGKQQPAATTGFKPSYPVAPKPAGDALHHQILKDAGYSVNPQKTDKEFSVWQKPGVSDTFATTNQGTWEKYGSDDWQKDKGSSGENLKEAIKQSDAGAKPVANTIDVHGNPEHVQALKDAGYSPVQMIGNGKAQSSDLATVWDKPDSKMAYATTENGSWHMLNKSNDMYENSSYSNSKPLADVIKEHGDGKPASVATPNGKVDQGQYAMEDQAALLTKAGYKPSDDEHSGFTAWDKPGDDSHFYVTQPDGSWGKFKDADAFENNAPMAQHQTENDTGSPLQSLKDSLGSREPATDKTPGGLDVVGNPAHIAMLKEAGYSIIDKTADGEYSSTENMTLWSKPDTTHDIGTMQIGDKSYMIAHPDTPGMKVQSIGENFKDALATHQKPETAPVTSALGKHVSEIPAVGYKYGAPKCSAVLAATGWKPIAVDHNAKTTTWVREGTKGCIVNSKAGWTRYSAEGGIVKSGKTAPALNNVISKAMLVKSNTPASGTWATLPNGQKVNIGVGGMEKVPGGAPAVSTPKAPAAPPPPALPKLPDGAVKNPAGATIPAQGKISALDGLGFHYVGTTSEGHDLYGKEGESALIKLVPTDATHTQWQGTNTKNGQTSSGPDAGSMASWLQNLNPKPASSTSTQSTYTPPVPKKDWTQNTDKEWQSKAQQIVSELWGKASKADKNYNNDSPGGVYKKIADALGVPWSSLKEVQSHIGSWQGGHTVPSGNKIGEWCQQIVNKADQVHPGLYIEHLVSQQRIADNGGVPHLYRGLHKYDDDVSKASDQPTKANVAFIKTLVTMSPKNYGFDFPMYGAEGFSSNSSVSNNFGSGGIVISKPPGTLPSEWVISSRDLNPGMWTGYAGEHEWAIAAPGAKLPIDSHKGDKIIHGSEEGSIDSDEMFEILGKLKQGGWNYEINGNRITIIPPADWSNAAWFEKARKPKKVDASRLLYPGVPPIMVQAEKHGLKVGQFANGDQCIVGAENGATMAYRAFSASGVPECIMLGFQSPIRARFAYKRVFSAEAPSMRPFTLIGISAAVKRGRAVGVTKPMEIDAEFTDDDHPRDEHGKFINVAPSDKVEQWKSGEGTEQKLNGITMKQVDAPDFSKLTNPSLDEPKFPDLPQKTYSYKDKEGVEHTGTYGKHAAAGVIVMEPDGRIWMYSPKNFYGGYKNTFSKGTIDPGQTPQEAAVRELHEETGLVAKIKGYLGDVERDTSMTRYYVGQRVGGAPWGHDGKETYAVRLVPVDDELRNRLADVGGHSTGDHKVLDLLKDKLGVDINTRPDKPVYTPKSYKSYGHDKNNPVSSTFSLFPKAPWGGAPKPEKWIAVPKSKMPN